jgi:hypothetical protein
MMPNPAFTAALPILREGIMDRRRLASRSAAPAPRFAASMPQIIIVTPAKAGAQAGFEADMTFVWIPAFAGMTILGLLILALEGPNDAVPPRFPRP